jgi:hypothetical protein
MRLTIGKPSGTATCQNCGNQWDVDRKGKIFKPLAALKLMLTLILLTIQIFTNL